ncbi:MAG: metal-dependent hydrolase, partial [Desulfurococcaceae archaeon]
NRRIVVYMGPLVSTGGLPLEGTEPAEYRRVGVAYTKHPFRKVYPRPTVIDAFSGPEIGYVKSGEVVEEAFIPWHRGFSHSITASLIAGLVAGLVALLAGYANYLHLAVACALGYMAHVLEDQLGFMGSNLLPPLTKKRVPGLMLFPRRPGLMNFATNWLMLALMIWNLNRFSPQLGVTPYKLVRLSTVIQGIPVHLEDYALLGILIAPTVLVYLAGIIDKQLFLREYRAPGVEEATRKETVEEVQEEVGGY